MKNNINARLLEIILNDKDNFEILITADNELGINVTSNEIINYLEFSKDSFINDKINGNTIITEGDILSVLKTINILKNYAGNYTIFINDDNLGTITYLIKIANMIYEENGLNVKLVVDYSDNYNSYLNTPVTIIGSETFIKECKSDFENAHTINVN